MCLHIWNFWQRHTWIRVDVLPLNPILNANNSNWRLCLYLPNCAVFAYSSWRTVQHCAIDVEIDLFQGLYKTHWDLECGYFK